MKAYAIMRGPFLRASDCQLRPAGSIGPNIKRKAGLTIDLISLKFLAFSVKFVD